MKQSQRRGPGRPPKKSHDKNKSGLSQRRGPGRPPKKSHDKNKSGLANSYKKVFLGFLKPQICIKGKKRMIVKAEETRV